MKVQNGDAHFYDIPMRSGALWSRTWPFIFSLSCVGYWSDHLIDAAAFIILLKPYLISHGSWDRGGACDWPSLLVTIRPWLVVTRLLLVPIAFARL